MDQRELSTQSNGPVDTHWGEAQKYIGEKHSTVEREVHWEGAQWGEVQLCGGAQWRVSNGTVGSTTAPYTRTQLTQLTVKGTHFTG